MCESPAITFATAHYTAVALALALIASPASPPATAQQPQPQQPPPPPPPARQPQARPPAPQPAKPPAPTSDPKIQGLPRVGEEGATAEDVDILQRAARKLLSEGKCSQIDYGDRSMSRPGWYVISCDGRNVTFRREDIGN